MGQQCRLQGEAETCVRAITAGMHTQCVSGAHCLCMSVLVCCRTSGSNPAAHAEMHQGARVMRTYGGYGSLGQVCTTTT